VFDISFAELMMIAVVALLVVGPDKLPQVARTVGAFVGRLQRYVAQVKEEVNRDARFEELQNLQQEIKQGADQVESSMMAGASKVKAAAAGKSVKPKNKSTAKIAAAKSKSPSKKSVAKKTAIKKLATKKAQPKKLKTNHNYDAY
jgi:sec-independent protein translocase protein TatB|tara:strand:- start:724 stop:1158 length:435 start_codon:yes stop_codon:yes gene_type:complete